MNAEAYLRKQGWQGSGHSLDSTGRGIKKPLLISHKQDQLGLGKKKAAHTTDDQWWMRAFDASLQSIGSGKEVRDSCHPPVGDSRDSRANLCVEYSQSDPHAGHQSRRSIWFLCKGRTDRGHHRRPLGDYHGCIGASIWHKHSSYFCIHIRHRSACAQTNIGQEEQAQAR
jgi:hypothetical protein